MSQAAGAPQPFRKRRPVVFFLLCAFGVFCAVLLARAGLRHGDDTGLFSGPRLGIIRIEGFIGDAEKVAAWAEKLRRDKTVAGVLVRINSPGGAVAPSQEMHQAVARLAAAKPVVVSMGAVASSGGYYIAVAGREIFANPSTLTGSIGVKMQLANLEGLMAVLGVKTENLATGIYKDAASPFKTMTPEERAYLEGILSDMQEEFVAAVAAGRNMAPEAVRAVADGRAFTGRKALELKLIDALGDQEAALMRLMALAGMGEMPSRILDGPEKSRPLWKELILGLLGHDAPALFDRHTYEFQYR